MTITISLIQLAQNDDFRIKMEFPLRDTMDMKTHFTLEGDECSMPL